MKNQPNDATSAVGCSRNLKLHLKHRRECVGGKNSTWKSKDAEIFEVLPEPIVDWRQEASGRGQEAGDWIKYLNASWDIHSYQSAPIILATIFLNLFLANSKRLFPFFPFRHEIHQILFHFVAHFCINANRCLMLNFIWHFLQKSSSSSFLANSFLALHQKYFWSLSKNYSASKWTFVWCVCSFRSFSYIILKILRFCISLLRFSSKNVAFKFIRIQQIVRFFFNFKLNYSNNQSFSFTSSFVSLFLSFRSQDALKFEASATKFYLLWNSEEFLKDNFFNLCWEFWVV